MTTDPKDTRELTIYFVGDSEWDAFDSLPFDSVESAESYMYDNPGYKLYELPVVAERKNMKEMPHEV